MISWTSRARDPVPRTGVVEHLAGLRVAGGQVGPGGVDVGGDQVQALHRARCGRGDPVPKMTEQAEPGGVSCTTR